MLYLLHAPWFMLCDLHYTLSYALCYAMRCDAMQIYLNASANANANMKYVYNAMPYHRGHAISQRTCYNVEDASYCRGRIILQRTNTPKRGKQKRMLKSGEPEVSWNAGSGEHCKTEPEMNIRVSAYQAILSRNSSWVSQPGKPTSWGRGVARVKAKKFQTLQARVGRRPGSKRVPDTPISSSAISGRSERLMAAPVTQELAFGATRARAVPGGSTSGQRGIS